jgi:hypothetical protein
VRERVGDPAATPVLLDEEHAHARVGIIGEFRHPPLYPRERCVVVAVSAAQLGDLQEAVGTREVAFAHRDLIGKGAGHLCQRLHDPRDPQA